VESDGQIGADRERKLTVCATDAQGETDARAGTDGWRQTALLYGAGTAHFESFGHKAMI